MSLSINTNLSSLMVQLSLKKSTLNLNRALEQMTTGYRINSAKDDAAGYAVATRMGIDLSSYRVAQNNANLGLSLLNTAESSLDIVTTHLQRIRDLAEQAANGTYGQDSIQAIQMEIDQRTEEINRIMSTTEYNGIKLFEGTSGSGGSTGGSGGASNLPSAQYDGFIEEVNQLSEDEALAQGYTIIKTAADLQAMQNDLNGKYILMNDISLSIGSNYTPVGDYSNPFTGEFNGNGHVVSFSLIPRNLGGIFVVTDGALIENTGVEVDILETISGVLAKEMDGEIVNCCTVVNQQMGGSSAGLACAVTGNISNSYVTVNGQKMGAYSGGLACMVTGNISNSFVTVNAQTMGNGSGGLACRVTGNISNSYSYISNSVTAGGGAAGFVADYMGGTIQNSFFYNPQNPGLSAITTNNGNSSGLTEAATPPSSGSSSNPGGGTGGGSGNTGNTGDITLQIGIDSSENSRLSFNTAISINLNIDVSTTTNARNALDEIDAVIDQITAKQTEFGAVQNRLDSIIDSLDVSIENTTSSLSTIKDADIAKVSSDFIRAQILQQASAALLATANQSPSFALNLI